MDLSKLTPGDQVIGISGIVLLLFSFFSWLGATVSVGARGLAGFSASGSDNAWGFTLTLIAVLIGLVLVAYVVAKAAGVEIPDKFGSVTLAQILLGLAAVAFLFVLIKIIAGPTGPNSFGLPNLPPARPGHCSSTTDPRAWDLRRVHRHRWTGRWRVPLASRTAAGASASRSPAMRSQ